MHIFGEMEDCKLIVRKLTQSEKCNEENSFQLNIAFSDFFHLKVTNMYPVCTSAKGKILCFHIFYKFMFAWCRKFISQETLQK